MSRGKSYRAGAIGRTGKGRYGHGLHLAYKEIDEVDLVAIADPDDEGRAAAKEETGAKTDYADYRDMLEKEDLDIVSVCPRWVDCHLEMVLACADAGCHIYCEKPIAMSLEDAEAWVRLPWLMLAAEQMRSEHHHVFATAPVVLCAQPQCQPFESIYTVIDGPDSHAAHPGPSNQSAH